MKLKGLTLIIIFFTAKIVCIAIFFAGMKNDNQVIFRAIEAILV